MATENDGLLVQIGATEKEYIRQLARMEARTLKAAMKSEKAFTSANPRIAKSFDAPNRAANGFAGDGLRNVSLQLNQVAQQGLVTGNYLQAMAIQLPDILLGFGTMGAVIGTVAALAIPLAANLFSVGQEGENTKEKIKTFKEVLADTNATVNASREALQALAADGLDNLNDAYGPVTDRIRGLTLALAETQIAAMQDSAAAAVDKLFDDSIMQSLGQAAGGYLGDQISMSADELAQEAEYLQSKIREIEASPFVDDIQAQQRLTELREELALIEGDYSRVGDLADEIPPDAQAIARVKELAQQLKNGSGSVDEQARAVAEMRDILASLGDDVKRGLGAEFTALEDTLSRVAAVMDRFKSTSDTATTSVGNIANEASRLADEIARAVDNAIALSAQGISDLRESEIRLQYRDDPVGLAGALASERFGDVSGVDPILRGELEKQREAYIANAEATETNRQALIAWQKEQAKAASAAKKSGGGRGVTKTASPLFDISDDQMTSINRQIEAIGMTSAQVAELTTRYRLLDEAQKRKLDLDQVQIGSNMTLRDEIYQQAAAVGDLTAQYEAAAERQQFFSQTQESLQSGIVDAIVEGENLSGVMENLAKSIAKAALQAALFGTGPMGAAGGLGGVFSGLFGQKAGGGSTAAGRAYLVGENGPELWTDSRAGRMLNASDTRKALTGTGGSQSGGQSSVHVSLDPGLRAEIVGESTNNAVKISQGMAAMQARALGGNIQNYQKRGTSV